MRDVTELRNEKVPYFSQLFCKLTWNETANLTLWNQTETLHTTEKLSGL